VLKCQVSLNSLAMASAPQAEAARCPGASRAVWLGLVRGNGLVTGDSTLVIPDLWAVGVAFAVLVRLSGER